MGLCWLLDTGQFLMQSLRLNINSILIPRDLWRMAPITAFCFGKSFHAGPSYVMQLLGYILPRLSQNIKFASDKACKIKPIPGQTGTSRIPTRSAQEALCSSC